jgi:hypothetical protein
LEEQGVRVEQELAYLVSYEPVDHLLIEVPRSLAGSGRLEVFHDGRPVSAAALPERGDNPAAPVRMRIALPKACIGPCRLTARYRLALQKPASADRTLLSVPLLMPSEGDLSGNKLSVGTAAGLRVVVRPGPWTAVESSASPSEPLPPLAPPSAAAPRSLQLTAARRLAQADFNVTWESGAAAAVVGRAWVQTWLSSSARQDRAVLAFTSTRKELTLTLPAGAAPDQISIVLDGKAVTAEVAGDGSLTIPLAGDSGEGSHLLELQYRFRGRPQRGAMSLEIPRLGRGAWMRRLYWQLILPRDEHLLASPEGFAGEQAWTWNGCFWGRQPLLNQSQLENWVGLRQPTPLPEQSNEYLFSAFGNIDHCDLYTAGRAWIVLLASGTALLAGLLLIRVRRLRHPAALLSAAVLLLAADVLYPEAAGLVAQAAVLGLALALLAAVLSRVMVQQRPAPVLTEKVSSVLKNGWPSVPSAPRPPDADGSTPPQTPHVALVPSPPDPTP